MRASLLSLVSLVAIVGTGCKKQREGLPPADEWGTASADLGRGDLPPVPGMGTPGGNPHGDGMAFGGGGGANPHAGVDMSGGGAAGGDPHAGVDMSGAGGGGPDVTQMLPPPDPNRKLDPNRRITGLLKLDPKLKDRVKASATIFVFAKRADASGQPTGFPLASEKLAWTDAPQLAFSLTDEDVMAGGTEFSGDVVLMARVDQDEDAGSKQPGDVVGQMRVKIPADNVMVTLDNVLP